MVPLSQIKFQMKVSLAQELNSDNKSEIFSDLFFKQIFRIL